MKKIKALNYSDKDLLVGKTVVVGLKGGTNLSGEVREINDEMLVLVAEPRSSLEIETQIVHTLVKQDNIDFIQFKTEREKQ